MTDKPIIFSAPMVRALLGGRKTQTRRVLNPQPPAQPKANCHPANKPRHAAPYLDAYCGEPRTPQNPRGQGRDWHWWQVDDRPGPVACRSPYAPGNRLWVREAYDKIASQPGAVFYRADYEAKHGDGAGLGWAPSIHMPRWASRLTLAVTEVRVQRLQEISEADAKAEGSPSHDSSIWGMAGIFAPNHPGNHIATFRNLWNSLHGPDAWDANPWVVALTFTVQHGNIDAIKP